MVFALSIEELDRIVDEILSNAEKERERILREAKEKAINILNKPIILDDYRKEADEIIEKAKKQADEIVKEAEKEAEKIRARANLKLNEAIDFLVQYVAGLTKE